MHSVKVTTIGNSLGIVLPRELLQRLRVDKGDQLFVVETRDGIELMPYQPEFVAQIEEMDRAARADRDVLRALNRLRPAPTARFAEPTRLGADAAGAAAEPAPPAATGSPAASEPALPAATDGRPASELDDE